MANEALPPVVAQLMGDISDLKAKLKEADGATSKTSGSVGSSLGNMTKIVAGGLAVAGAAAVGFGASCLSTFEKVAGETSKLSRLTGESAESMSRLRGEAQLSGVSADTLTTALKRMSKGVDGNTKAFNDAGIATEDMAGKILPASDILGQVADKFASMPDGVEKTSMAMKLFGRGGADMIPMLDKGRAGLAALGAESDKFGLTIGDKNVADFKKNQQAHREMSAAWQGLQTQIGAKLMPVIAELSSWFAAHLPAAMALVSKGIKALEPVFDWIKETVAKVMMAFETGVPSNGGGIVGFFTTIAVEAKKVVDWVVEHWPQISGVISAVMQAVGDALSWVATNVLPAIVGAIRAVVDWVVEHWPQISGVVMGVFDWIRSNVVPVVVAIAKGIADVFSAVVDWIRDHWSQISDVIGTVFGIVKGIFENVLIPVVTTAFGIVKGIIENVFVPAFHIVQSIVETVAPIVVGLIKGISDGVSIVFGVIRGLVDNVFKPIWNDITGAVQTAHDLLSPIFDKIGGLFSTMAGIAKGAFDGVIGALKGAWNAIAGVWNSTIGKISFTVPGWVPGLGGDSFSMPNLPTLHTGGIIPGPIGTEVPFIGLAGERVQPITAAQDDRGGGAKVININVAVTVPPMADPAAAGESAVQAITSYVRQRGNLPPEWRMAG